MPCPANPGRTPSTHTSHLPAGALSVDGCKHGCERSRQQRHRVMSGRVIVPKAAVARRGRRGGAGLAACGRREQRTIDPAKLCPTRITSLRTCARSSISEYNGGLAASSRERSPNSVRAGEHTCPSARKLAATCPAATSQNSAVNEHLGLLVGWTAFFPSFHCLARRGITAAG